MERYYRWHAHIYDLTRWTFLFGRQQVINRIPKLSDRPRILEIGCGTGQNIHSLKTRFPNSEIMGIDLSEEMLKKARKNTSGQETISLYKARYPDDMSDSESFDLILCSYSLTMIDSSYDRIAKNISAHLTENGIFALVDFHNTPHKWFERWMRRNHARMDGSLLPVVKSQFKTIRCEINPAYLGWWSYLMYVGKKK